MLYNFEYWLEHAIEKSLRIYNGLLLRRVTPPNPSDVKKILICAYHGIGNFILYTPTIAALKQYYPNAEIDLQTGNNTGCEYVLEGSGHFKKHFDISNRASWRSWFQHIRKIRRTHYDIIISEFHSNSYFLALMVSFSGALYRVGHVRSPGWPDRYGFIYNLPVKMAEAEHEVDRYFGLAQALGVPGTLFSREPFIHLEKSDHTTANNYLIRLGITAQDLVIGIQMGTSVNMRWKQWPPVRYRELITRLARLYPQAAILMLGSASEVEMIREWTKDISERVIIAAGEATLKESAALVSRCTLLVCNDSGLMHVAVAVKTPVVAIYGPTDYRRTAPLGDIHTMVSKHLACSPCFKLAGDAQVQACGHHDCLNTMEVTEVLTAVQAKLHDKI